MALNFKKNISVGVSVTPNLGLEVAQVDFVSKTVVKYGLKQLAYDNARKEIADMDIFKETLSDLLTELEIPKGAEITLNLPSVLFKVTDYPASMDSQEITNAIENDLLEHPIFQNTEGCISAVALPNSTIQFNKIAYEVAQKSMLIEIAMQINDLGYKLTTIDTSVNSFLNALIYNQRVDVAPDATWVMLIIEDNVCRIIPMQGRNYIDTLEERISIGEVLGDAENYSTVVNAVNPILKNLPSQRLYVISKTNIISAKILAEKLIYNGQIIHQEANSYASAPFLETSSGIDEEVAKTISLDVVGAAINRDFATFSTAHLNLFNESLGDIYLMNQPLSFKLGSKTVVLSIENMIVYSIIVAVIALLIIAGMLFPIYQGINQYRNDIADLDNKINEIQQKLDANKDISAETFDEGDEIRIGLQHNKNVYTYFTIVGTEIPRKLWLTYLKLGDKTTIEGQADNLESVYSFFRNIKDYEPDSAIKLQKLGLATTESALTVLSDDEATLDKDSILTSMNADFYEFRISDAPAPAAKPKKAGGDENQNNGGDSAKGLPELESIE